MTGRRDLAAHFPDSPRARARVLVVVLGLGILVAVFPYASGLIGAGVLWVVFAPAYRRLAPRVGARTAAALAVVGALVLVVVPGAILVALSIERAPDVLRDLQDSAFFARIARLRVAGIDVGTQASQAGGAIVTWLSTRALRAFAVAAHGALNVTVALFGLYFMLVGGTAAWPRLVDVLPFSPASAEVLRARFVSVTEAMLLGIALTAALQGSIVGVGFWAVGLPDPLFWGAVTAVVSVLPVLGSALVWLPGTLALALMGRYGAALALAVIGGVVASNIDNVMRPLVYRRVSQIHPLTTVVGAFAGVEIFGLAGVLLGPLAISYFFELLAIYHREYGAPTRPGTPTVADEPSRRLLDGAAAGDAALARSAER